MRGLDSSTPLVWHNHSQSVGRAMGGRIGGGEARGRHLTRCDGEAKGPGRTIWSSGGGPSLPVVHLSLESLSQMQEYCYNHDECLRNAYSM